MYCAQSPRLNNRLKGLVLSTLAKSASSSLTLLISTLATDTITSPSLKPARAAASVAASTRTPPLALSSRFCASVKSDTVKPNAVTAPVTLGLSSFSGLARAVLSGSNSPIVTIRSLVAPRRNTVRVLRVPGLVLPTRRGRSEDFSIVLPSILMMMSPASMPAFSAGEPGSTPRTSAPCGLPKPIDSATSLVT